MHYTLVNPWVMSPGPSTCLVTRCPTLHVPCSISCDIPAPVRDPTCGHPAAAAVGGGSQGHKVVSTVHCSAVMGTLTPTLCLLLCGLHQRCTYTYHQSFLLSSETSKFLKGEITIQYSFYIKYFQNFVFAR